MRGFQRLIVSVAACAILVSAALAPPAAALEFAPGSTFVKGHPPLPQPFEGFVPPGSTQGAFSGTGYEDWIEALEEVPELHQAGGRADFTTSFQLLGAGPGSESFAKDVSIDLPAGSVSNPFAVPPCSAAELHLTLFGRCPTESQVGIAATDTGALEILSPVSRLTAPPGEVMSFGFKAFGVTAILFPRLRSESDYGLTVEVRDASTVTALGGIAMTLWGVPHDPVHDSHRFDADVGKLGASVPGIPVPLTATPTNCATGTLRTEIRLRTWSNPDAWITADAPASEQTGCDQLEFHPQVSVRATTVVADVPTGLDVDVHVPQSNGCEAGPPVECDLATSHLKDLRVTLPDGMAVNLAGANGLEGCSPSEVGLTTPLGSEPIHFSGEPPACPDASKVGTAEIETPLVEGPIDGAVYLASPHDNPFHSLLAIYIAVENAERGIAATFAGEVAPDPRTGRLAITFEDLPQLPIEHIGLELKQGPHAFLRTPPRCGSYPTSSRLTSYAAPDLPVVLDDSISITRGPAGTCDMPGTFAFEAGAVRPIAGVYSPFVLKLHRADGSRRFRAVSVTPPPGIVAKLDGVDRCPLASLEQASNLTGSAERMRQSCPAGSEVGEIFLGSGSGPSPYYAEGKVYLAGPYKGAPLSLAVVVPATTGPLDLGTAVVRVAVHVDPHTARVTAVSDQIPEILHGIPLDVRTIHIALNRERFMKLGTSCDLNSVDGHLTSDVEPAAGFFSRFQLADCAALGFRPKAFFRVSGGLARNGHPEITAVVAARVGEANIAAASLALPSGELLDTHRIDALCDGEVSPRSCPDASRIGHVRLFSPVTREPFEGPLHLRRPRRGLPDLVADLRSGQLRLVLRGHTVALGGRTRVHFPGLPDVPLTRAVFKLAGGKRGVFVNSETLCGGKQTAAALLTAHSGRHARIRARVRLDRRC